MGFDKTISQPFIVALMTDLLELRPEDTVLEIGTGLGYQAAILAELAGRGFSIEVIEELAHHAKGRAGRQGLTQIRLRVSKAHHPWADPTPLRKALRTP